MSNRLLLFVSTALLALGLALAGCGGSDGDSDAQRETDTVTEQAETLTTADTEGDDATEDAGSGSAPPAGPALASGAGTFALDDGRSYALTMSNCDFNEDGKSFTARGASAEGYMFELVNFHSPSTGDWFQSSVTLELPQDADQIYALVTPSTEAGTQPQRDGSSIAWTLTVRELDDSANQHIYTGEATVRLTCP